MSKNRAQALKFVTEKEEINELSRKVLEASGDPIYWVNREGSIIFANKAVSEYLGFSPEQLANSTIFEINPSDHPGNWPEIWERLKTKKTFSLSTFHKTADGQLRPVRLRVNFFDINGFEFYSSMVTSWNQPLSQEHVQQLFRTFADSLPNGILVMFDRNLRYTMAEGKTLDILGFSSEKMLGRTPADIFPREIGTKVMEEYKTAIEGTSTTFEIKAAMGKHTFLVNVFPLLNSEGQVEGGMAAAFDINYLKAVEKELEHRIDELSTLNDKLSREILIRKKIESNLEEYTEELKIKNKELEQFAYVASHDLQEPLRMISSFTQLLARKFRDSVDGDSQEYINFILEGAQRMQTLINDLLSYSRIGTRGKKFEETDLNDVLERAIQNMAITIGETDAIINYGKMPRLHGDDTQLVQLVQNLISNAIKFRKKGQHPVINISYEETPTHFVFKFQDNGIGLNPHHKERIFQIFQRLHTRDQYPGTGIGLAVCKRIAERHGGDIWVESEEGKGAAFFFSIRK